MTGISDSAIMQGVIRLAVEFRDDIGSLISITGTGFFICNSRNTLLFITNRHNLDPTLKLGANTPFKLSKISFYLRKKKSDQDLSLETRLVSLKKCDGIKHALNNVDVSAIYNFEFSESVDIDDYKPSPFLLSELADTNYFFKNVSMMDSASFVGFPGTNKGMGWWDQEGNLPIARMANIASYPNKSFINKLVDANDVILVSGLSFSGSSGSPIFLHQKGVLINAGHNISVKNDSYVQPKIIGIMSGHWWDENKTPEMFRHSGLSYFTKSTAIHDLMNTL